MITACLWFPEQNKRLLLGNTRYCPLTKLHRESPTRESGLVLMEKEVGLAESSGCRHALGWFLEIQEDRNTCLP